MQEITDNSDMRSSSTEYQIHYWALTCIKTFEDGSSMTIAIPTVLFNYPQEVSAASVDFELKDVEGVSEQIEILHNIEVNTLMPMIELAFPAHDGWEYASTKLNNLHRHPGSLSSFSVTDLNKSHITETGIVFPLKEAKNESNFASIILHKDDRTTIAHTEFRIAEGNVDDDLGITYTHGRCFTYVKAEDSSPSQIEQLLGYKPTVRRYDVADSCLKTSDLLTSLKAIWDEMNYSPNTQFILPENITKKTYTQTNVSYNYNKKTVTPYFPKGENPPSHVTAQDVLEAYQSAYDEEDAGFSNVNVNDLSLQDYEAMKQTIEQMFTMRFYTTEMLDTMSKQEIIRNYEILERVYYGCSDSTDEDKAALTSNDILEMYMLILESYNDYGPQMLFTIEEVYCGIEEE